MNLIEKSFFAGFRFFFLKYRNLFSGFSISRVFRLGFKIGFNPQLNFFGYPKPTFEKTLINNKKNDTGKEFFPVVIQIFAAVNQADETSRAYLGREFVFAFLNQHLRDDDTSYTENLTLIINNPNANESADVSITSIYPDFVTQNVTVPPRSSLRVTISHTFWPEKNV
jgi:hypothetical protein